MTTPAAGDASDPRARLAARLAADPDGVIETLAREHGLTTLEATRLLPARHCRWASPDVFAGLMAELTCWGEVLFIVHTPNIVLECTGAIPPGSTAHGHFNLHGDSPIGGHIKADRCAAIAFVRRPFMGRESCSIQFFDHAGESMFKIFVRRTTDRNLAPDQLARFEAMAYRMGR